MEGVSFQKAWGTSVICKLYMEIFGPAKMNWAYKSKQREVLATWFLATRRKRFGHCDLNQKFYCRHKSCVYKWHLKKKSQHVVINSWSFITFCTQER